MADMKSMILAQLRSMNPDEKDKARALIEKLGIKFTDKELNPYKAFKVSRPKIVLLEEYNIEIFNVCTTCGRTTEQFFRMKRLPDNSGTCSERLSSRDVPGEWRAEYRYIKTCGQCFQILIEKYTLEEMARVLVRLGSKGISISEYLHG